ncbi:MAG: Lpg1974 family pore-forming outer membrane protein, partial [Parachlamydiales bacterium]
TRQAPARRRQQPARAQSEQAAAADTAQQSPSTRQAPARRRQHPARAQSEQAAAADTARQSPSTRQAPARRRQQPARAQSEQASAADSVQQSPSTRQTPARRRQQPVRAQSEQASAASKAEQKPASAQSRQQPQVSQRTQRSSSPRQSSRPVETAQAEDDAMQPPARTTPRQRAYYQSSPRNTREQGRLQAQSNGANMGTPYTQKINQSSMQPSGPKENSPSQLPQAINMPARPVVQDGWNLWILGEALLWQAVQENMEYIYKGHDGSNNSRFRDIKKPHFDWDWGWRFGAGYNIPRDGWDLSLIWTHIENRAKGTTHAGDESLDIVWSVAAYKVPSPTVAHAHWEAHLDQVDLDLGRQFYVGRHLTLHPKAGMRSSWIFQEYDVRWTGTQGTQKAHMTDKFWGLGFFAGLDSDWMLGWGFSLFGDAGLAVLLGYFDVDQHGTFNGATNSKIKDSFRTGRPIFDLDLGLKWARKIYNERFALAFKVGYEYHLYFNQNQFLLSNGNDGFELFNPVNGDLTYQGVTFSGQFDF